MNFVTHPWHISLGLYRKTSMISVRMIICEAQPNEISGDDYLRAIDNRLTAFDQNRFAALIWITRLK
jgi:hypothetical protein